MDGGLRLTLTPPDKPLQNYLEVDYFIYQTSTFSVLAEVKYETGKVQTRIYLLWPSRSIDRMQFCPFAMNTRTTISELIKLSNHNFFHLLTPNHHFDILCTVDLNSRSLKRYHNIGWNKNVIEQNW